MLVVPEAATTSINGGIDIQKVASYEYDQGIGFQKALIKMQIHLEDTFESLAMITKEPTIMLIDRGLMDGSAYITKKQW